MKLILSLILIFSVTSTHAAPTLKEAFDELNYSLTVEWDQTDQAFYHNEIQKFESAVAEINPSAEDLIILLKSEIKDEKAWREISMLIDHARGLSPEEARIYLSRNLAQGASWNGVVYVLGALGSIVVIYFTLVILDSLDITA